MTTQSVAGRRYFTKAWLLEQKIADCLAGADSGCVDHEPKLFYRQ
ncbi:Ribose transport system permease protein rbsC [Kluyvera intermedia]|nr:Ribose transport system permease protein rbsC [Kluyvera intermedia]